MNRCFALICAGALLAACHANPPPASAPAAQIEPAAKPAPDIKGLKLGDSKAAILAKYSDAQCDKEDDGESCHFGAGPYGGSPDPIYWVLLANDKARLISVTWLKEDKFDTLLEALSEKLGPPSEPRGGLTGAPIAEWRGKGWGFLATRRAPKYGYSKVELIDTDWALARKAKIVSDVRKEL